MTPLHPQTRRWLAHLQGDSARYQMRRGRSLEEAAEHGTALAQSFAEALADGTLIEMPQTILGRALVAGTLGELGYRIDRGVIEDE